MLVLTRRPRVAVSTLLCATLASSLEPAMAQTAYYRKDGVRITHDPHAPGMSEKYGRPGETDAEGFDPYADSVGPGIYGGIVKRDGSGQIVVGRQYQNHNPRPGPVYAGGGYTPVTQALRSPAQLAALLDRFPDLVNDVSTGGAQPLHNCGMSAANQEQAALLISRGADADGARAGVLSSPAPSLGDEAGRLSLPPSPLSQRRHVRLPPLCAWRRTTSRRARSTCSRAGADPARRVGGTRPRRSRRARRRATCCARCATTATRAPTCPCGASSSAARRAAVNGEYAAAPSSRTPGRPGACASPTAGTRAMWAKLGGGDEWFAAANGAAYYNHADGMWWIDAPNGDGVYKRPRRGAPPAAGWQLSATSRPRRRIAVFRGCDEVCLSDRARPVVPGLIEARWIATGDGATGAVSARISVRI